MRIDAHVHYTPPALAQNLDEFARQEPYWGLLLNPPAGQHSVQGWATAEKMIEDMDRAGLDKIILMGEYFQKHESCIARNDQAIELVRRWPDRVVAFAVLQPKAGKKALDELRRTRDKGLCGVGELNPYAQGYLLTDPDFLRVVEACLEHNMPLNLHVSEQIGPYYLGKSTTPLHHYYQLARLFPELTLILAHWGGGLIFYETMPRVRQILKNVWYDTAASPLLYSTNEIFKVALNCINHQKILYGSDYPLRLYPRQQQEPNFDRFMDEIAALDLPPAVYGDIMGNNAARMLGLAQVEAMSHKISERSTDTGGTSQIDINGSMTVRMVAETWPQTRAVFEKFGISWQESPVPVWEPITQAAAAHGWDNKAQQRLLETLNLAISE